MKEGGRIHLDLEDAALITEDAGVLGDLGADDSLPGAKDVLAKDTLANAVGSQPLPEKDIDRLRLQSPTSSLATRAVARWVLARIASHHGSSLRDARSSAVVEGSTLAHFEPLDEDRRGNSASSRRHGSDLGATPIQPTTRGMRRWR